MTESLTVREKVAAGAYCTQVPWRLEFEPIDEDNLTGREVRELKERRRAEMAAQRRAHDEDQRRLNVQLAVDLADEHGIAGHPKAERLFQIAWDLGHGHDEIASYYERLAELLRP